MIGARPRAPERGMKEAHVRARALLLAAALLAGGCTVGPPYRPPSLETPARFAEADPAAAGPPALERWWTALGDPELDALVAEARAGNLDLAAAASRVSQARQETREALAAELPKIDAAFTPLTFNSDRKAASADASTPAAAGAAAAAASGAGAAALPIPGHLNLYSAGFDASWEADLFGGERRAVEAARANAEASAWARRDGDVSLVAEVVRDYVSLRALQLRAAIGRTELERQRSLFALIRDRRAVGLITALDVDRQSVQVETAAAELPALDAAAKAEIHALGVLTGRSPGALAERLAPRAGGDLPPLPARLAVGLPSDLLRRRPDIREAERRLAAANAEIGVQTAKLYPSLNLLALGSFAGTSIDALFDRSDLQSAALGGLTQPLFNGGAAKAAVRIARDERDQALFAYKKTVLTAFQNVEDALARLRADEDRDASLARSLTASTAALALAEATYRTGLSPFINVLQAQNARLQAQDQELQARAAALSDLVALDKALGGDQGEGAPAPEGGARASR